MMKLDQQRKRITIDGLVLDDEIVFGYFNHLKEKERESTLIRAIQIGVLALEEDHFSSFLAKTKDELGAQLESLKIRLDMKQRFFQDTAKKGLAGETDILSFLESYVKQRRFEDELELSGKIRGELKGNKTGDILSYVNGQNSDRKIAIECKFDKAITLGDIDSNDIANNKKDTAWSQLLEASVNRDANTSIIVFDKTNSNPSILQAVDGIAYIDGIGFICVIDYQASDYQNLAFSYNLARSLALRKEGTTVEGQFVNMLIRRMIKDIDDIKSIQDLVKSNIDNNKTILKKIEKSILTFNFVREYLEKYLKDSSLSKSDLLKFYQRSEIRDKYKVISNDIERDFCAED